MSSFGNTIVPITEETIAQIITLNPDEIIGNRNLNKILQIAASITTKSTFFDLRDGGIIIAMNIP